MTRSVAGGLLILALFLASCGTDRHVTARQVPADDSAPQAWIDAPLDRMQLPLAPYEVVFHATDGGGIAGIELLINQQPVSLPTAPKMGGTLVTAKYAWSPASAGEYLLQARGQGASGEWGDFAEVRVTVGEPTPTVTPTLVTPTPTATPVPAGPAFLPSVSASSFYYGACSPSSVEIRVQVTGVMVDSVLLMVHLVDQGGSGRTDWYAFNAMNPLRDGGYGLTVPASAIQGYNRFASAWFAYQFVAAKGGVAVARSAVFSDVTLSACGRLPILQPLVPPVLIVTPTHGPIIK